MAPAKKAAGSTASTALFDPAKFKREHERKTGEASGFVDPVTWIDTGNYALNRMISGDFHKGIPLGGCVTVFAGESGSAKSYIVSGQVVKNALDMGCLVALFDTEGALSPTWLKRAGVDTDHPNLMQYRKSTTNEIAQMIRDVMEGYTPGNRGRPRDEQQKLLFVVDSLGFVETEAEIEQFKAGDLKGDRGIKPKILKMLIMNCLRIFSGMEVGLLATNHSIKAQSQYESDSMTGGQGFVYAASILVMMNKLKLKAEETGGAKFKPTIGIRSKIKVEKSRFAKPFEEVEIEIPYDHGLDPLSGFMDLAKQKRRIVKDGNGFRCDFADGTSFKGFQKDFTPEILRRLIAEWQDDNEPVGVDETPDDIEDGEDDSN